MSTEERPKIKVIRIIARLNIGGPAIHTVLLSDGLDKDKFQSILVSGRIDSNEGDMSYYARSKNVYPVIIPQLQREINPLKDFIALVKIYLLIKKEKPDIIHTHTAKAGALGRTAGVLYNLLHRQNKCILVHTFHGTVLERYFGRFKSYFFIIIERTLAYFSNIIIVVSVAVREELVNLKIGRPQKINVIPLGLELEGLLNILPASHNNSVCRFGIVGRLAPVKNHRLFLAAIKIFLSEYPQLASKCSFTIIGDGQLRYSLENEAYSLGIKQVVQFYGWNLEAVDIYSSLDVVVLTSLKEGTPVSLIEAMAAARAVIATDVGGVRDIFNKNIPDDLADTGKTKIYDNGILCRSSDAEGLAQAFSLLTNNSSLREEMGKRGRAFARNRFSKERLIKDVEMLYNNCLKRSS